jgi:hypothetical protein
MTLDDYRWQMETRIAMQKSREAENAAVAAAAQERALADAERYVADLDLPRTIAEG